MSAPPFLQSFGKLTAVNREAVAFLSGAFQQSLDDGDGGELRHFVSITEAECVDDPDLRALEPIKEGFFRLSLNPEESPRIPTQGWTAGRGLTLSNKKIAKVDLVLGRRRSGIPNSDISPLHMSFNFNSQSGALMIQCLSVDIPIRIFEDNIMRTISFRESRAISKPSTRIRLGRAEYRLDFTIEKSGLAQHFDDLNHYLMEVDHERLNRTPRLVQVIPGLNSVSVGSFDLVIKEQTLAGGSFGMVNEAIDIATGESRALKRIRVNTKRLSDCSRENILKEYQVAVDLEGRPGILRTYGVSCEHGLYGKDILKCTVKDEFAFILSDLGFESFAKFDWSQVTQMQQLEIFRQTLLGIQELHKAGYAHRDIQVGNLLVLSINPPRGCIMDFGKAKRNNGSTMTSTAVGPIYTVAPEVWTKIGYSERIDLFSWAVAIAWTLKFDIPWLKTTSQHVTKAGCEELQNKLAIASGSNKVNQVLFQLLNDCLNWEEKDRPNVQQALCYDAWKSPNEGTDSSSKRPKLDDSDITKTVPFSKSFEVPQV